MWVCFCFNLDGGGVDSKCDILYEFLYKCKQMGEANQLWFCGCGWEMDFEIIGFLVINSFLLVMKKGLL